MLTDLLYINNFIIMSMTSLLKCPQKAIIFAKAKGSKGSNNHCSLLEAQVFNLQAYCKKQNFEIIKEFRLFESIVHNERECLCKLIDFIKQQKTPVVLVVDSVNILQRNFKEIPILEELRLSGKLEIHFIKEKLILNKKSKSSEVIAYQMLVLMAAAFFNNRSATIKRGLQMKKDRLNNQKSFVSFCI